MRRFDQSVEIDRITQGERPVNLATERFKPSVHVANDLGPLPPAATRALRPPS
jgi:hypothetical protein